MTNILITVLLLFVDAIGAGSALLLTYSFRFGMGQYLSPFLADIGTVIVLTLFWWLVFLLSGLYRPAISITRFDEIRKLFKSVVFGLIIIFIATIDVHDLVRTSRLYLFINGLFVFIFITVGRMAVREFQIWLRWKGRGMSNSVIVGFNKVGHKLNEQLQSQPVWGHRVIGFVDSEDKSTSESADELLGEISDLPDIVQKHKIKWILLAPGDDDRKLMFEALNMGGELPVRFMIVADYYQMVGGFVQTVMVHGLPLVEIATQSMSSLTAITKRIVDILIGAVVSMIYLLSFPLIALLLRIESRESITNSVTRIGKERREFTLRSYRLREAGSVSGPLHTSRLLRRLRLCRLPEFVSVLVGNMSIIGPRAKSPEFCNRFNESVPLFRWRYRIKPGLTGWSQIRSEYSETVEDVTEMTKYDLYYIEKVNLGLDAWIMLSALKRTILRKQT